MTDEEFAMEVKPKRTLKVLKLGQKVWIVRSNGELVKSSVVSDIKNSYAVIDGHKYWLKAVNGKHRNRNNYTEFAMNLHDTRNYTHLDYDVLEPKSTL